MKLYTLHIEIIAVHTAHFRFTEKTKVYIINGSVAGPLQPKIYLLPLNPPPILGAYLLSTILPNFSFPCRTD